MRSLIIVVAFAAMLGSLSLVRAQEMPAPAKEHAWLKQFVGEWETEVEIFAEPGKPSSKLKGKETGRMLGDFWIITEGGAEFEGVAFKSIWTLGYSPEKKKLQSTWVSGSMSHLWVYEGTVDETGKHFTFVAEGPCPKRPGQTTKFRDTMEFKSPDHRVVISEVQNESGQFEKMMVAHARRKK